MLQDPPWCISGMYYNSPIRNFYTDGSVYNGICCSGFIEYNRPKDINLATVMNIGKVDIHYAELVALETVLSYISNNYDPSIRYEVNTDSDSAYNMINSNSNKSEVDNIRRIISNKPNIKIRLIKSHLNNPADQQRYIKGKGERISINKAKDIIQGNKRIDSAVKGCATAQGKIYQYNPVPFRIEV